jgi:chromosome partitioning protein
MAEQLGDQRPRRRLFGRRRDEDDSAIAQTAEESADSPAEPPGPTPTATEPVTEVETVPQPENTGADELDPASADPIPAAADGPDAAEKPAPAPGVATSAPAPVPAPQPEPSQPEPSQPEPTPEPVVAEQPPVEPDGQAEVDVDATAPDADLPTRIEPESAAAPEPPSVPEPAAAAPAPVVEPVGSKVRKPNPLPLPRILAIANQKGGVGKTTTAVNLGAALAESGLRVLVVDLDPQGNASTGLGINPRDVEHSVYDVLMNDVPALDCVEPTSLKNLFVLPATIDLAGAEIELVPAFSRELKLKRALDLVRPEYDVVLIDCPPSLGLLTVNGLAAADDVIVPIQCEYYALEGLGQLLRNVALVRALNPTLDVRGIVLTMHDARTRLAEQVESEVREHFDEKVYLTVVPRTVRLSEAPSFGQPIIVFDPTSRGASAYRELAKEVRGGATRRSG